MLNGRLFPIAEASSKKVAKKDAAAATLRILIEEMQGGAGPGDQGNTGSVVQVTFFSYIAISLRFEICTLCDGHF